MNTKLNSFIKRNRRRNSRLYQPGLTQGIDYVVCPVSQERLLNIRSSYITKVLGLTVEEYDRLYPNTQKSCQAHKLNIKSGLHKVDPVSGFTRYQIGQHRAKQTLSAVDESGLSGYKKKGEKTRSTHMSKIDQFGRNGYSQIASKAIIKGNQTKSLRGIISLNKSEFKRYKTVVTYLTEKFRCDITQGYITGLAGTENAWHIDHKFSILKGYQNKVSPFIIGHRQNLQMIPWEENLSKNIHCNISLERLLNDCKYTLEQSVKEFDQVIKIINSDIENNIPPNAAFLIERLYETNIYT
jgi:hypothetical protein